MINIAIDGPAGAGKSTIAKALAKKLGLIYLDTGAIYRSVAYFAIKNGVDVKDEPNVKKLIEKITVDISYNEVGEQQLFVCGENVTPHLREHYMSKAASDISALPSVRAKLLDLQRDFAKSHDVVLDGRDIGTVVLPNANFKFFMTATSDERARRRYTELLQKGETVDYGTIKADIEQRDYNDAHRAVAPLKQADDAVLIDTTKMSIAEVVAFVESRIQGE